MSFYVKVKNMDGMDEYVEVTGAIYQLFEEERKRKERERYERRIHLDSRVFSDRSIEQELLYWQEERAKQQNLIEEINAVLATCTKIQQERFRLYYVDGYTYEQIARLQKCHKSAVKKSVYTILDKLEKYF